jgi:hypothetical protein
VAFAIALAKAGKNDEHETMSAEPLTLVLLAALLWCSLRRAGRNSRLDCSPNGIR